MSGPLDVSDEIIAKLMILSLPKVGPARAAWLLQAGSAVEAVRHLEHRSLAPSWGRLPSGVSKTLVNTWFDHIRKLNSSELLAEELNQGAEILDDQHGDWPFSDDPEPPLLLFCKGDTSLLGRQPSVAIVGTRRCTAVGRRVAFTLGADLAEAGVAIVSGLAAGIDTAAHRGALSSDGAVIGIAGTGLDVVYPASNYDLWQEVASRGLLATESRRGTKPERWRFPARNRLIAGLVDAVIVVESHKSGGALLTVDEAAERGCPVFAVPGSVMSPASDGSNNLLRDGCNVVTSADDVLAYLDLVSPRPRPVVTQVPEDESSIEQQALPLSPSSDLLTAVVLQTSAGPVHIDQLVVELGIHPAQLLGHLRRFEQQGHVSIDGSTVCLPDL